MTSAPPDPHVEGRIKIMSFGFKYGLPNANHYFDVSFTQNPARQKQWGMFGVVDHEMIEFVLEQKRVSSFIEMVIPLMKLLASVDAYQVVAFGCNSGRHRSPIIANEAARRLAGQVPIVVEHRDLPDYEKFVYSIVHGKPEHSK